MPLTIGPYLGPEINPTAAATALPATKTWLGAPRLLHDRRRRLIPTDRRDDIHEGFLALACCLICWRGLENSLSWDL